MRDMHIRSIDRKISRIRAEKRAGIAIVGILAVTAVCAVMIHLDATLKAFGTSGHLGV
jgi:hypothetical protein